MSETDTRYEFRAFARDFGIVEEAIRADAGEARYRQGYLSTVKERTVRVRSIAEKGYLTGKGISTGIACAEFVHEIPLEDANAMLDGLCERPLIEKDRYKIPYGNRTWEVDEFFGDNAGLIMAEVELEDENESLEKPRWIGREVSDDARYFNANLMANPYRNWGGNAQPPRQSAGDAQAPLLLRSAAETARHSVEWGAPAGAGGAPSFPRLYTDVASVVFFITDAADRARSRTTRMGNPPAPIPDWNYSASPSPTSSFTGASPGGRRSPREMVPPSRISRLPAAHRNLVAKRALAPLARPLSAFVGS